MKPFDYQDWAAPFYAYAGGRDLGLSWWVNWDLWQGPHVPGPSGVLVVPHFGLARCDLTEILIQGDQAIAFGSGIGFHATRGHKYWNLPPERGFPVTMEIEIAQSEFGTGSAAIRVYHADKTPWMHMDYSRNGVGHVYLRDKHNYQSLTR